MLDAAQGQPRPLTRARLLAEAERSALISCERGARLSREASGIHYYLRRARNDPTNTVLMNSCVERPSRMAGTASLEETTAPVALVADDVVAGTHVAGMSAEAVVVTASVEAGTAGTLGTVKVC